MQFKAALALSLLAAAQVTLAQPPACLLAALNNQANPADYKTICSKEASTVQKDIQSACSGSDKSTALSSFAGTCKQSAGVTVSSVAAASSSASGSASASASGNTLTSISSSPKGATVSDKPSIVTYSSAYFNSSCDCTLTSSFIGTASGSGTSAKATATGFSEGGSGGSGSGSSSGSAAGASATAGSKSRAGRTSVGSFAGIALAAAGVIYIL